MKKYIIIFTTFFCSVSCDSKETLFNGTLSGEYKAQTAISLKTGKSYSVDYKLVIKDTLLLYKDGNLIITLNLLKTIYKNAKEGKWIVEGYDFTTKKNQYIRLVYPGWWDNRPDSNNPVGGLLILDKYEQSADTIDVYYQRLR